MFGCARSWLLVQVFLAVVSGGYSLVAGHRQLGHAGFSAAAPGSRAQAHDSSTWGFAARRGGLTKSAVSVNVGPRVGLT